MKSLLNSTYKHNIYSLFLKAIKEYELIKEGDHVMVAISGGKDSLTLAMCFKELENYSEINFKTTYVCMNPGYKDNDLNLIKDNFGKLGLNVLIFDTNIFKISKDQEKNKCYVCAKMRRGALYNKAKELGANKVALGHHFNDVIETLMMSILYQGEVGGMKPMVKSDNYDNEYIIRPLYMVEEKDIINYITEMNVNPIKAACLMEENESCEVSKRKVIKKLINDLDDEKHQISKNIFKAMSNINTNKLNIKG